MFSRIEIPHFVTSGGLLRLARKSEGGRTLAFLEKRTALRHYAELQKSMYNYTLVMTRKVKKSHSVMMSIVRKDAFSGGQNIIRDLFLNTFSGLFTKSQCLKITQKNFTLLENQDSKAHLG